MIGKKIHELCERLYPINRSITGDGVRETLGILKEMLPDLSIVEVPTGTQVFDWVVPMEWRVRDAYIKTPNGKKFEISKSTISTLLATAHLYIKK